MASSLSVYVTPYALRAVCITIHYHIWPGPYVSALSQVIYCKYNTIMYVSLIVLQYRTVAMCNLYSLYPVEIIQALSCESCKWVCTCFVWCLLPHSSGCLIIQATWCELHGVWREASFGEL